jgi:predicted lipoprotein
LAQARNGFLDQNEANSEEEATSVNTRRRLVLAAALVAAAVIGFSIGKIATAPAAGASAAHRYTLRVGDKVTIPALKQRCAVYTEVARLSSIARDRCTRATK